jgi:hypothetical protein
MEPVGVRFSGGPELAGYALAHKSAAPGDTLQLRIAWRAVQRCTRHYTVFTHLVAPTARFGRSTTGFPAADRAPLRSTRCSSGHR